MRRDNREIVEEAEAGEKSKLDFNVKSETRGPAFFFIRILYHHSNDNSKGSRRSDLSSSGLSLPRVHLPRRIVQPSEQQVPAGLIMTESSAIPMSR